MYKIKAKLGYNVIIEDLDIILRSYGNIVEVSKTLFDTSKDAKKVLNFIDIVDCKDNTNEKIEKNNDEILQVGDNSFVTRPALESNPKDVFIAKPAYIDQVIEQKAKEIIEDKPIEIETNEIIKQEVEAIEETKEIEKNEITEVVAEQAIEVKETKKEVKKVVKDKKPSARKNVKK